MFVKVDHVLRRDRVPKHMAAHAVGGGGIEAVGAEEPAGRVRGQHLAVKEHAHLVGIPCAELHIVGHHDDGDALAFQLRQNGSKNFLKEAVDALGRLVQQKQLWLGQQHLRQRRPLLLAAGQVVGMAFQQRRNLADFRRFPDILLVLGHFLQIFQHGFPDEQALGILGQHGKAAPEQLLRFILLHRLSQHLHLTPVGSANAANSFQRRGFSRAVAAHNGVKAALDYLHAGAPENVRAVLFIAEPQFLQGKSDFAVFLRLGLRRKLGDLRLRWESVAEPVSALPHGQGARPRPAAAYLFTVNIDSQCYLYLPDVS